METGSKIIKRTWPGHVLVERAEPCPRCGHRLGEVAVCFRHPEDEIAHGEYWYCIKCGEGVTVGSLHLSREEWEALP